MQREEKRNNRSLFWSLALGIVAVALILVGGNYNISQMQKAMWEQTISNVLEVTQQGAKAFEVYLSQGYSMLADSVANFSQCYSSDEEDIATRLDLYEDGDPSFMVLDLTDGILYFNGSERTDLTKDQLDSYLALPEQGFLEPFISMYDGRRVVGYYDRFDFADGAKGMVLKSVPVSEIADKFSLSFFDGAGFSYIVDRDGDIILRSNGERGNRTFSNVFDVLVFQTNSEQDVATFREAMENGKSGVIRLAFNDEMHVFAFVPITDSDGWMLISVVPDSAIMEYANKAIMSNQTFLGIVAIAAMILVAFVLVMIFSNRRIKKSESEVLHREQLFNILVNQTDDVYVMLGSDGNRVEYLSPNVERITGVPRESMMTDLAALQSVIHSGEEGSARSETRSIPLGSSVSFEGSFVHQGTGDKRWYTENVYHTEIDGVRRYILTLSDRTADRQKEAALMEALQIAEVANKSKSAFLSNMSHDIRTPMNAIVGLSTLLARDANNPEKVREHTRKITSSSQHLLGLINDVLDMSKIESGSTSLSIGEFNLAELVDELGTIMRPQAKTKGQEFYIVVKDVRDEHLIGDKLRISQVMINILSNAVKYTPEGGHITFTVQQLGQVTKNIARIRFTVEDDGIGMSEEYQETIFEPFTREVSTLVNQIQGTGLGMAITKNLVDLMGGTISVESTPGEGSTFSIEIDLRIQDLSDDDVFWEQHGIRRILVVDDDVAVCDAICAAMEGTGVDADFALNGPTAVSKAKTANKTGNGFDLILMDWKMPGMDGFETAQRIREAVPSHIPIIIVSSYDYEDIRDDEFGAGIDGFMPKPFFMSNFKEAVRSIRYSGTDIPAEVREDMFEGRHFLCAEDSELNAAILEDLLDMEGATCKIVPNGQEAVNEFMSAPEDTYDAILMDVQMPVMNGYEATRAIRSSSHSRARRIPIVALTANAFADDARDSMNAGMDAHVAKPVDMEKLISELTPLMDRE